MKELSIHELENVSGGISPGVAMAALGTTLSVAAYAMTARGNWTLGGLIGAGVAGAVIPPVTKGATAVTQFTARLLGRSITGAEATAVGMTTGTLSGVAVGMTVEDKINNKIRELEEIPY